ncbi:glycosyltransferase family 4 protein [Microbacterium sp. LRZ72]|uniref:glycosyltransferase family 4 protein n=1 Tax=Microbacterium sp. LRZ72 TaxID=2942481 RepID=UPI0029BDD93D|nr:glycosyltransferase family 4 protein [Microbacterium sp. LRZ72]MDX2377960.1 glycosyltransferase family 4 protein [Microbacterium sp. LRZ72]
MSPRRSIALVCDYSLDYMGGAQSAFLDEAMLLRERGHRVVLVVPFVRPGIVPVGPWREEWLARGGDIVPVPAATTLPGIGLPVIRNSAGLRRRLGAELAVRGVDVVHVHSEFGLTAAVVSAARRAGIGTVQTVHTFFWRAPIWRPLEGLAARVVGGFVRWLRAFPTPRQPLAPQALESALRNMTLSMAVRVDAVISPSAHQAERLEAAGLSGVRIVPNAVAAADGSPPALTSVSAPLRIVWVGRLAPEKRLREWIDAVATASALLPPGALDVEVIGEGPARSEAEARARETTAPIRFTGRLSRGEVQERMRAAHLVALTSFGFDNQPVTIVEALHARRGVLYVDPSLTEGVDVAGLRAETPDVAGMADLLVRLARDPAPVVAASSRAEEGARAFDPDVHVERLLAVYEAVSAGR